MYWPECEVEIAAGSLLAHRKIKHIMEWREGSGYPPPVGAQIYQVSFPNIMT